MHTWNTIRRFGYWMFPANYLFFRAWTSGRALWLYANTGIGYVCPHLCSNSREANCHTRTRTPPGSDRLVSSFATVLPAQLSFLLLLQWCSDFDDHSRTVGYSGHRTASWLESAIRHRLGWYLELWKLYKNRAMHDRIFASPSKVEWKSLWHLRAVSPAEQIQTKYEIFILKNWLITKT